MSYFGANYFGGGSQPVSPDVDVVEPNYRLSRLSSKFGGTNGRKLFRVAESLRNANSDLNTNYDTRRDDVEVILDDLASRVVD